LWGGERPGAAVEQIQDENAKLKKLVADLSLDGHARDVAI